MNEIVSCSVAQSCRTFCDFMVCPWNSSGKNTGVCCHSHLQGIFPTQGSNLDPCIAGEFFTIQVTRKAHRTKSTTKERFIIVVKVSVNEINVLINETAEKSLTLSIM